MPHDKNGNLIELGDIVNIRCKVTSVQADPQYCNVTVQSVELMPPYTDDAGRSTITLNTKQVELVEKAPSGEGAGESMPGEPVDTEPQPVPADPTE